MLYIKTGIWLFIILIGCVTFSASFAQVQVTIPLGASKPSTPFSLSPSVVDIKVNDTVQWNNNDIAIHTVTTGSTHLGFDGRVDSGTIAAGGSFSHTFDKIGVYNYYCLFHPWMTGLVNVGTGTQTQPELEISVFTDKTNYRTGDTIMISGNVSRLIPNDQVTVWVTDPKGQGVATSHIETETGNYFSTSFVASGDLWSPGNEYKVYAQYGSKSPVAMTPIQLESIDQKPANEIISNNTQTNTSANASYMLSPKKMVADSANFITAQTVHDFYIPGEQVQISGSVWNGLFQKFGGAAYLATALIGNTGSNTVTELINVKVKDINGTVVSNQETQADAGGDYSIFDKLPQDGEGKYTVESIIETKAGLVNTLDLSTLAKLSSTTNFVVTNPDEISVSTGGGSFSVGISSNSTVSNFQFKPVDKKLSFLVQGETGTKGVTRIDIPKELLSGQLTVLIDGTVQPYNSENVILVSDTPTDTSLEINYHHSSHTIEITGTYSSESALGQSVPEFSSAVYIVLVCSVISIIIFSRTRQFHF